MHLALEYLLETLFLRLLLEIGWTAISRGHPSHAKVWLLAVQREYLHFSVIFTFLRPSVMVRPRESNPRPPALLSSALPTELILPQFFFKTTNMEEELVSEIGDDSRLLVLDKGY